jgi:DNA-binding transcriptional regulator GbsR (MarR family)
MKLEEAKQEFINSWGVLGTQWGINRTMAQIHALLLVTADPMHAEEIMEALQISRGNANMNLRDLMTWGLVDKVLKPGERREFFTAEKDIWKVSMRIIKERRKRELDPMLHALDGLKEIEGDKSSKEVKAFTDTIANIQKFARQADGALEGLIKADENWFTGTLLKLFKK